MILTIEELKVKLTQDYDELELLEMFGIDAHMLVERFADIIEDRYDELLEQYLEEEEEDMIGD